MGYGDHLIAAGLAEDLFRQDPSAGPVTITDLSGKPRWQPLWNGNPAISVTANGPRIACGGGCLPYLVYPRLPDRLTFSSTYHAADHRCHLYLTDAELALGRDVYRRYGPYVVIEPYPRDRQNLNRQWPRDSWELMIGELQRRSRVSLVQCDHEHATRIGSLPAIATPTFRDACGVFAHAALVVCLEGGIPFATAALDTPTVVLWGGCISAPVLAYPEHVNIVDDARETPCGRLTPCDHCARAWLRLTPSIVATTVLHTLQHMGRRHGLA